MDFQSTTTFKKEHVEETLHDLLPPLGILHVSESTSTNRDLMTMAETDAPAWTVLVSDRQTEGRGRRSRPWASPEGGLYFSILLKLPRDKSPITLVPLTVGLALAEGLYEIAAEQGQELSLQLKWPNDLLSPNGKLAGILCETALTDSHWLVVAGVGINIRPLGPDIRKSVQENTPTSLMEECDIEWTRETVLIAFLRRLKERLDQWETDPAIIRTDWTAISGLMGKRIRVRAGKEPIFGIAEGINDNGALKIRTEQGSIEINAAEGIEVHE